METNIPWFEKESERRMTKTGQIFLAKWIKWWIKSFTPGSQWIRFQNRGLTKENARGPVPGAVDIELEMCHRVKYSGVGWPVAAILTPQLFFSVEIVATMALRGCCWKWLQYLYALINHLVVDFSNNGVLLKISPMLPLWWPHHNTFVSYGTAYHQLAIVTVFILACHFPW